MAGQRLYCLEKHDCHPFLFEFAVSNEWLPRNPSRLVKDPRGQSSQTERVPFSDEELSRMFAACEEKYAKRPVGWSRRVNGGPADGDVMADSRYRWNGQDLADFISISVYTGLRISDVTTFHVDRVLSNGEVHVRTTKNGRKVYTWIPDWLQDRIQIRAQHHGPLIFGDHKTTDINVVTDVWRRKLNVCGPCAARGQKHPHRIAFDILLRAFF